MTSRNASCSWLQTFFGLKLLFGSLLRITWYTPGPVRPSWYQSLSSAELSWPKESCPC